MDKDLIESSFAKQYGIRLSKEDMHYPEYRRFFNGLMDDTPLGRIISIRSEKDKETLKRMGAGEKKIRSDWIKFRSKQKMNSMTLKEKEEQVLAFQEAMKKAFWKGGKK